MKRHWALTVAAVCCAGMAWTLPAAAQGNSPQQKPDKAEYVKHYQDPVLKAMEDRDKKQNEAAEAKTKAIDKEQKALEKARKKERKDLRFDMSHIRKPASPDAFTVKHWFFPPVPQYLTGTCWDFSTTSFLECEANRLSGVKVKLSEMWTAYHEYLLKAEGYIATRGHSVFDEGSESNAVLRVWKKWGVVPEKDFPGTCVPGQKYDHSQMIVEMQNYLKYCKSHNYWNQKQILATLEIIMQKYMGVPPKAAHYQGKTYTPKQFLHDVLKINPDDYVSFMSTESIPFWTKGEYRVPDNWWHSKNYYNVPLNVWYATLVKAVKAGSTVAIGGDVSEPGYNGFEDAAIIPSFDIPQAWINQDAREFRIYDHTTTDDHGVQVVGWTHLGDHDWFLIKDSARASRHGKFKGYMFYRDDYVKMKMRTYMVNKQFVKDVLKQFKPEPAKQEHAHK
ncbi:MAG: C1 family peptidase [Acidobacteriota bacterium]